MFNDRISIYCVMFNQHSLSISIFLLLYTIKHLDGCTIPDILQSANWDYDFDSTTATLYFTSSGMTGLSFTARGEVLNTYTCIANTDDVYVFKSSQSYSHRGDDRWIYLCMKMTRVSENLHYFYLLADLYNDVTPIDRVLSPPAGTVLSDNSPPCTDFCSYTTPIPDNDVRPLKREGTSESLPGGETLCGTCASPCASPGKTNTTNNNTSNANDGLTDEETAGVILGGIGGACICAGIAGKVGYMKYTAKKKAGKIKIEEEKPIQNNNPTTDEAV